jgi:predicted nucleic acid-binding protein
VPLHDAMIIFAPQVACCKTLFAKDMQDGLKIDLQPQIRNLFGSGDGFA